MKKIFFFLLIIIIGIVYYFVKSNFDESIQRKMAPVVFQKNKRISPRKTERITKLKKSIFVPYWNIDEKLALHLSGVGINYDKYIYFGITVNAQGLDKEEIGFQKLDSFVKNTEGKETYLTLRLLNNDFNRKLLKENDLQQKIIEQTIEVAKKNNFKGIVLDLELFSLFDTGIKDEINLFVQKFYTAVKSNYKSFAIAIYGDVFYRRRPYDLLFLNKNSDEILVMAYDFSKAIGEPGPNFPYDMGLKYSYSFKKMVFDFTQIVPAEKLTIIFGMYGYDWKVDEKKRPITTAKALTLKEIQLDTLRVSSQTAIKRDSVSKETEINYTVSSDHPDEQGIYRIDYHIVWYEDEESVKAKTEYLKEQGIESVGYWAWGYF